jgi:hypothetical protein
MRGKPWTVEEERQLRQMLEANKSVRVIAKALGKTRDCVRMKIVRLGLEVVVHPEKSERTTTTELILPEDLPSVEEALKILAAAMEALKTPGLSKTEVMRLRSLIQAASAYQVKFAAYVDYRGIEAELLELREKYEELAKKSKGASAKPAVQ